MTKLWGVFRDPKYIKSFAKEGEHTCLLTNAPYPDGAHIRHGFLGAGMKPDDNLVIPLRHDLHQIQHNIGEVRFWEAYYRQIPYYLRRKVEDENPDLDIIDLVKIIAKNYYESYKARKP